MIYDFVTASSRIVKAFWRGNKAGRLSLFPSSSQFTSETRLDQSSSSYTSDLLQSLYRTFKGLSLNPFESIIMLIKVKVREQSNDMYQSNDLCFPRR